MKLPPTVRPPLLVLPQWQQHGCALVALALAIGSRKIFGPYAQDAAALAPSFVAVMLVAWFCSGRTAAWVACLGYAAALWPFHPAEVALTLSRPAGIVASVVYAIATGLIVHLCDSLRRVRSQYAEAGQNAASILENMRECFCALGRNGRVAFMNPRAEKYLGLTLADAQGRILAEAIPHLAGTVCAQRLARALESREPSRFECLEIVPGQVTEMSVTPSSEGMSLFLHDVTAEKRRVQHLEQEVAQRTAELRKTVAELETFSYTLVHDMRAPLRAIRMFAATLSTDDGTALPEPAMANLKRIEQTAARMDRLIVDVLNYSLLTRQPVEVRQVDLDEVVREAVVSHPAFSAGKAEIEIERPLPTVRGNEALLGQCFSNLLQNATKFVAEGVTPRVSINAIRHADRVFVSVHDNGIGIAAEATERIFEPFQREDSRFEGTGIGLAIVRKVVERLGGRVGVESAPGQGSRFWVELPAGATPDSGESDSIGSGRGEALAGRE